MATKFQFRRDAAATWTLVDPVLSEGEIGVETDTLRAKLGDGSRVWSLLPYWEGALPQEHADLHAAGGTDELTLADIQASLAAALPASYGSDNKLVTEDQLLTYTGQVMVLPVVGATLTPANHHQYSVTGDLELLAPTLPVDGTAFEASFLVSPGCTLTYPASWLISGYQNDGFQTRCELRSDGTTMFLDWLAAYTPGGTSPDSGSIVYVKPTGSDSYDGLSWDTAKQTLQAGMTLALSLDADLWVAGGTYNVNAAYGLEVPEGVRMFGGFAGTEASLAERISTPPADGYGASAYTNETLIQNRVADFPSAIYCVYVPEPTYAKPAPTFNGITFAGAMTVIAGAVSSFSSFHLTDCIVKDGYVPISSTAGYWYAAGIRYGSADYTTIQNNYNDRGTQTACGGGSTYTATYRCKYYRNKVSGGSGSYLHTGGGGAYGGTHTYTLFQENSITALEASYRAGGGACNATCYFCKFLGNTSVTKEAGAQNCSVYDCEFTANSSVAAYVCGSGTAVRCVFTDNRSSQELWAGSMTECVCIGNSARLNNTIIGGGDWYYTKCWFIGNWSEGSGPLLSKADAYECVFAGNYTVGSTSGPVLIATIAGKYIVNCLFVHNGGARPYIISGAGYVQNCVFWRNTTETISTTTVNNCKFTADLTLSMFAAAAPDLAVGLPADMAAFTALLQAHCYDTVVGSAVIDAGNDSYSTSTTDLLSRTRKIGTIDCGPYEYQG